MVVGRKVERPGYRQEETTQKATSLSQAGSLHERVCRKFLVSLQKEGASTATIGGTDDSEALVTTHVLVATSSDSGAKFHV